MAPRRRADRQSLRTSSTGLPMDEKGWIFSTSLLSIAVMPSSAYLSSRCFEHLAGHGTVFGEHVALLHALGAFLAGQRGWS